jgi:hypothetical protein
VLEVESAEPGDELLYGGKAVGRVTSSIEGRALAFVRVEVPEDATLEVGSASKTARVVGP